MTFLRRLGRFWWDFVVGDDWRVAAGLAVLLGACAAVAHDGVAAWWVVPVGVVLLLAESLRRASR
jgi:hypothetical protein